MPLQFLLIQRAPETQDIEVLGAVSTNEDHYTGGVTDLWSSIVPVKLTSHPTNETCCDANLLERRDCDAGGSRHVRIEMEHGDSVARRSVVLG